MEFLFVFFIQYRFSEIYFVHRHIHTLCLTFLPNFSHYSFVCSIFPHKKTQPVSGLCLFIIFILLFLLKLLLRLQFPEVLPEEEWWLPFHLLPFRELPDS